MNDKYCDYKFKLGKNLYCIKDENTFKLLNEEKNKLINDFNITKTKIHTNIKQTSNQINKSYDDIIDIINKDNKSVNYNGCENTLTFDNQNYCINSYENVVDIINHKDKLNSYILRKNKEVSSDFNNFNNDYYIRYNNLKLIADKTSNSKILIDTFTNQNACKWYEKSVLYNNQTICLKPQNLIKIYSDTISYNPIIINNNIYYINKDEYDNIKSGNYKLDSESKSKIISLNDKEYNVNLSFCNNVLNLDNKSYCYKI